MKDHSMKNHPMKNHIDNWLNTLSDPQFPDEFEVKRLLSLFGITVPKGIRLAPGHKEIPENLSPPFAAKVCSGRILHKTDQKGVILNLDKNAVIPAVTDIQSRFQDASVLLEEQMSFNGTEFIVGALIDPDFGPAVMAGSGGVLTELYEDVSFRLAPCSTGEAKNMLKELNVSPFFTGFRGVTLNPDGLAHVISKTGELALALGNRFGQLDINPIVCTDKGWVALDAKLVLQTGSHL